MSIGAVDVKTGNFTHFDSLASRIGPEQIMAARGMVVYHAMLNRWVVKYWPLISDRATARKRAGAKF